MNPLTPRKLGVALLTAAVALLSACGHKTDESSAGTSGALKVLNYGNDGEVRSISPFRTSARWEVQTNTQIFEGLTRLAEDGKITPGLASSWDISKDGLTYTFHLRDNLKFSDGSPLKASDVLFSLRTLLAPETASEYGSVYFPIKNAEAFNKGQVKEDALGVATPDDHTVVVTLEHPTPYLLSLLSLHASAVVSEAAFKKYGPEKFVDPANFAASGAYTVTERIPSDHITLVKNPYYYNKDNVKIDKVILWETSSQDARLKRYEAGEFDITPDIDTARADELKAKFGDQLIISNWNATYYYIVNQNLPKFKDNRVRRAMNLAIDRESAVANIFIGMKPAYSFIPPGIGNYEGAPTELDFKAKSMDDRIKEAQSLMKAAGYGPDKPLQIKLSYDGLAEHKKLAVAVASQFEKIYIKAELVGTDTNTHWDRVFSGEFEVARARWISDFDDAFSFIDLLGKTAPRYTRYHSDAFNKLADASNNELDLKKRAVLMHKAERIALDDNAVLPVINYTQNYLVSPKVKGFKPNSLGIHVIQDMDITQ